MIITNAGKLKLSDHLRIRDLTWMYSGTTLDLDGYVLYLTTNEHAIGSGTVISNGGRIMWGDAPVSYYLTVLQGPHGTATVENTGWHLDGNIVTNTATPDPGYDLILWQGDVAEADRTNYTVELTMNQTRDVRALFGSTNPTTRTWLGFGSLYATNPASWYLGQLPVNGDSVALDATSISNLVWDLDVQLTGWNQQTGYDGIVTIRTRYPSQGGLTNLAITGNCTIADGTWVHPVNAGTEVYRLKMTVGGDFFLSTNAVINLDGRGYSGVAGPGKGVDLQRWGDGTGAAASYGGRGAYGWVGVPAACYGTVAAPTNLGSGTSGVGGGALDLQVAGTARVDGTIRAFGTAGSLHPGSARGSIWMTAGYLEGIGLLVADGAAASIYGAGGGRVAASLTSGNSVGGVRMRSLGGIGNGSDHGAAGTVYLQKAAQGSGQGTLTIDNNNTAPNTGVFTEIPPTLNTLQDLAGMTLILTNRAYVGLTANVTMGDLFIRTNTPTRLYLRGYTLKLTTKFHLDWGNANWVVYEGGQILWAAPGSVYVVY